MATVIITGGTGMVGTLLSKMLIDRGDKVIILTTQKEAESPQCSDTVCILATQPAID